MAKQLISFDLDQTLVKTIQAHSLSFQMAFKTLGFKVKLQDIYPYIDGRHSHEVISSIAKRIRICLSEKKIQKIRILHHKFLKKNIKYAKPIKKTFSILKKLKRHYNLALVTNCVEEEAYLLLKKSGIDKKLFDIVVLANQVKHPKPWPDEIIRAEHLLHVNSDIHIGDSIYDILAAKNAKAISISVLTGQATKKTLKRHNPDYIIKSIADLPKILEKIGKK